MLVKRIVHENEHRLEVPLIYISFQGVLNYSNKTLKHPLLRRRIGTFLL